MPARVINPGFFTMKLSVGKTVEEKTAPFSGIAWTPAIAE
jgi:hypothetical protein